jgi:hypothetical protein
LQFEVGIQTFNPVVAAAIRRRQNYERLEENLSFLRRETGVHVHADLIVGLPGESVESLAAGFDRLVEIGPQEIQVGILKRLRGTPIVRHDAESGMVYSPHAPYEILRNRLIDFATMQRLRRFARFWDLTANSGNFILTTPLLWKRDSSAFRAFLRWSDWLGSRTSRRTHGIALVRLAELLFEYLTVEAEIDRGEAAQAIWEDYRRGGRSDKPAFLRPFIDDSGSSMPVPAKPLNPKRQARHLAMP